jgi:hypothetical protein
VEDIGPGGSVTARRVYLTNFTADTRYRLTRGKRLDTATRVP